MNIGKEFHEGPIFMKALYLSPECHQTCAELLIKQGVEHVPVSEEGSEAVMVIGGQKVHRVLLK